MNPQHRVIFCVVALVILLPVAALGIVSGGQTIDGKITVTYSPIKPIVGQPLTLRVIIYNTGTTSTTYRLCYKEQGSTCKWYTFSVSPEYSQKYNFDYTPKEIGDIKFDFGLYWYQNNLQTIPLQNVTETVSVYPSQSSPISTPPVTTLVSTQTTKQPTTNEELIGFDVILALITIFTIVMLKKGK